VREDRVIQFGGRICDKPEARIEAVSLERFEDGARAELVTHGQSDRFGMWLPPADSPDQVVARAEWLLDRHPPGRYSLVGWNCEHAANWCVNRFTESLQVRKVFLIAGVISPVIALNVAPPIRNGQSTERWLIIAALAASGFIGPILYNVGIGRFWRDLGNEWDASQKSQTVIDQPTPDCDL
jgi:hypothetical protein